MTIRYRVAECRKRARITQKELSQRSGVSTAMISFIENNQRQPTINVLALLAKSLELTIDDIVVICDNYCYFHNRLPGRKR